MSHLNHTWPDSYSWNLDLQPCHSISISENTVNSLFELRAVLEIILWGPSSINRDDRMETRSSWVSMEAASSQFHLWKVRHSWKHRLTYKIEESLLLWKTKPFGNVFHFWLYLKYLNVTICGWHCFYPNLYRVWFLNNVQVVYKAMYCNKYGGLCIFQRL